MIISLEAENLWWNCTSSHDDSSGKIRNTRNTTSQHDKSSLQQVNHWHINELIPHQLCFKGLFIWRGVKLTYTINRQEGSLVAGAGSRSQEQAPEPRAGTKRAWSGSASLFKREIYHAPVGWYFSSYWLTERKSLPAALWAPASVIIGWGSGSYSHNIFR